MRLSELDQIARSMGLVRRQDANPSVFVENELKQIVPQMYNRLFPELEAMRVIPGGGLSVSPGATSYAFDSMDQRGSAKWLGAGSTDFPRADVSKDRHTFPVRPFGVGYGWTIQEIVSAQFAGIALSSMRAEAARRASAEFEDAVLLNGDAGLQIPGFLTNSQVPIVAVPNGSWETATPDDMIADVNFVLDQPWLDTKQVHRANTVLLPPRSLRLLQTRRLTDVGESVLSFIQRTNPGVAFEALRALQTAGPGGAPRMLAYERGPDMVTSVIPMPFTQLEPQIQGFEVVVPTWQLTGGTVWIRPASGVFGDGI